MNMDLESEAAGLLKKKQFSLSLPDPWPEAVDLAALLEEIAQTLAAFVVLPPHGADALALWVLHTYLFEERDAVAYVAIESPEKRCGKTTLLSVLAALACKPLVASNVSVGALFSAVDEAAPTLLIDEADTFLSGNSIMRGVINCGNTWRTAYVLRSRGKMRHARPGAPVAAPSDPAALGGTQTVKQYSCWCPKVVAMIGTIPETIADRSIVIKMSRKLVEEKCLPLRDLDGTRLVRQCVRAARDLRAQVKTAGVERIEGLNDRAADTYEPLAVIARIAGGGWPEKITAAAQALNKSAHTSNESGELLLEIVSCFFQYGVIKLFSTDLVRLLRKRGATNSARLFAHEFLTEHTLAKTLRPYGIRPVNVRIGARVGKGYDGTAFREALQRYVPEAEIKAKQAELVHEGELLEEANKERKKEETAREEDFFTRLAKRVVKLQPKTPADQEQKEAQEKEK